MPHPPPGGFFLRVRNLFLSLESESGKPVPSEKKHATECFFSIPVPVPTPIEGPKLAKGSPLGKESFPGAGGPCGSPVLHRFRDRTRQAECVTGFAPNRCRLSDRGRKVGQVPPWTASPGKGQMQRAGGPPVHRLIARVGISGPPFRRRTAPETITREGQPAGGDGLRIALNGLPVQWTVARVPETEPARDRGTRQPGMPVR